MSKFLAALPLVYATLGFLCALHFVGANEDPESKHHCGAFSLVWAFWPVAILIYVTKTLSLKLRK